MVKQVGQQHQLYHQWSRPKLTGRILSAGLQSQQSPEAADLAALAESGICSRFTDIKDPLESNHIFDIEEAIRSKQKSS